MLRYDITDMSSSEITRRQEIQTLTMTTNEEICLEQLQKEPKYPCRISIEVLFHVPYKACAADKNSNLTIDNEQIDNDDQIAGNISRTGSLKARALNSYKRFFH
jgi:hypothetical protein